MTTPCTQLVSVVPESTISIRVVRGLVDVVEQSGVSRQQFLRAARLAPERLENSDARVPRSEVYRWCELAMDLTGDSSLGLHWGEHINANTMNPISDLIAHAPTLRDGLEALVRFHRLLSDYTSYQMLESQEQVTIRCMRVPGDSQRMQRFTSEVLVTGVFRLVRSFSAHANPVRVAFEYPTPSYRAEYARLFQGVECFDQPFTEIVFDRRVLSVPSPYKDEDLHVALRSVAERHVLRLTKSTPYFERVRELLVQQALAGHADMKLAGPPDMKSVARMLGLSVRSLRRRLAAEGRMYNVVANDALAIVAKRLLRDHQRTIQEAAYEMGFSDASAFHRAFKRWTGTTPRAYRDKQLWAPLSEVEAPFE